jgi:hypothetical protein
MIWSYQAMENPKSWQDTRAWFADLLQRKTGEGVEVWNQRVADQGPGDKTALIAWLEERGVTGYAQTLLVWERFGYPDFLTASADELIEGQYADRPHLRPVLEAVLAAAQSLGPVTVQARKTYISLVTPRRTFAVVKATTRKRVDLGFRLDGQNPEGRLLDAKVLGNDTINVRLALGEPADLDEEALQWLTRAYEANLG